jgi:hypothetical protein
MAAAVSALDQIGHARIVEDLPTRCTAYRDAVRQQ